MSMISERFVVEELLVKYPEDIKNEVNDRLTLFKKFAKTDFINQNILSYVIFSELEKVLTKRGLELK